MICKITIFCDFFQPKKIRKIRILDPYDLGELDAAVLGPAVRLIQLVGDAQQVRESVRRGIGHGGRLAADIHRPDQPRVLASVLHTRRTRKQHPHATVKSRKTEGIRYDTIRYDGLY